MIEVTRSEARAGSDGRRVPVPGNGSAVAASLQSIEKVFGVTRALRGVCLEVQAGTIHALVGENGAGKSTALGILAGRIEPTSGSLSLFGQQRTALTPREARNLGLAAIYQELTTVPALGAEANVFVGQTLGRGGLLLRRRMRARYLELCQELGVPAVPAGQPSGTLSVADQQLLEIMRAMASDAQLILFDEPTAALGMTERRALLRLMTKMRDDGRTIVFVSHNLDEVLEVSDTITVFRSGEVVSTRPRQEFTKSELVRNMLGDDADLSLLRGLSGSPAPAPAQHSAVRRGGNREPVLTVSGLGLAGALESVDVDLRAGEILGLGGLVGSGRTSVLRCLAGLEPGATGELSLDGNRVPLPRSVRRALRLGIALVPEDRKVQGLALDLPAGVNVTMSHLRGVSRSGWISESALRQQAQAAAAGFGFDPRRIDEPARRLSGGNQQKLLLARWRFREPRILLVDEPTRGIDVGAKAEVLKSLEEMASRGLAIIVVSSELEELVAVCDRIVVLAEGRVAGRLDRDTDELTVPAILDRVFAGRQDA